MPQENGRDYGKPWAVHAYLSIEELKIPPAEIQTGFAAADQRDTHAWPAMASQGLPITEAPHAFYLTMLSLHSGPEWPDDIA